MSVVWISPRYTENPHLFHKKWKFKWKKVKNLDKWNLNLPLICFILSYLGVILHKKSAGWEPLHKEIGSADILPREFGGNAGSIGIIHK